MKFIILLLFLIPSYAQAVYWEKVVTSKEGDVHFVDITSLLRIGDKQSFWRKINFPEKTIDGELSSLSYHQIDCANKKSIILHTNFYTEIDNQGKKTDTILTKTQDWKPVLPNTVNAVLLRYVCKR